ncbi:MAG: diacylglycerol/polyprenol kinase family protein [Myxococcota bacterium]
MLAQNAITLQHRRLVEDLYLLIQTLDPATFKAEMTFAAEEMIAELKAELAELLERADASPSVQEQLQALKQAFEELKPTLNFESRDEWRAVFKRLQDAYEKMAVQLRSQDVDLPVLRQTNYKRSLVHALNGVWTLIIVQHGFGIVGNAIFVTIMLSMAVTMEVGRKVSTRWNDTLMRVFDPIAHPHEVYKINSATWYLFSLLILAYTMAPVAQALGVVVLGLADPAAGFAGRRFGRRKLIGNKSFVGTGAFIATGFAVSMLVLGHYYAEYSLNMMLLLSGVAALSGALGELFTLKTDDNFTIPIAVAVSVSALLASV